MTTTKQSYVTLCMQVIGIGLIILICCGLALYLCMKIWHQDGEEQEEDDPESQEKDRMHPDRQKNPLR